MADTKKNLSKGVGWVFFGGTMMVVLGLFQAIAGLTALLRPTWYLTTSSHLLVFNYTAWGWIDLLVGAFVLLAGFSLLHGSNWARVVGIGLASLSALGALASISAYPIWSIVIIAIDVLIIHAIVVHGDELQA